MPRVSLHVEPRGIVPTARHYIGDLVYGANDGVVTTFAAVAGAEGGALSTTVILIVGVANLVADGLSMGIGNYLAIRSREQVRESEGLPEEEARPVRHGLATFAAFVTAGSVPLLPYLVTSSQMAAGRASTLLAAATLFGVGAARSAVTIRRWWVAGFEVLALGAAAGAVAFAAGRLIGGFLRN